MSFVVKFWVVLGSRLGSGFCSEASFSGSGSGLGLGSGLGSGFWFDSGVSGLGVNSISKTGLGS